jgi:hypothetical protein
LRVAVATESPGKAGARRESRATYFEHRFDHRIF